MSQTSRFALLLDLAKEPSSDKRRDLLREVTDLFFESDDARGARERVLFDEVLRAVAQNVEEGVLAELSHRFADAPNAPEGLIRDLAGREISVAEAVLRRSSVLSEQDLLTIIEQRGQEHVRAVASRKDVSETLSAAIVKKGDDITVDVLMRNQGARLDRETMETVVDRARASAVLHDAVVLRPDLPMDLLNEMYFVVEQRLRTKILSRNASVSPEELDAALAKSRTNVQHAIETATEENKAARKFIFEKKARGELSAAMLIGLYRDRRMNEFLHGLGEMTGVDFETARRIIVGGDLDALATICKAAGIERPLFVTLAVLACGGSNAMARAEEFGRLYVQVPIEAAQRALRFMKVRRGAGDVAESAAVRR